MTSELQLHLLQAENLKAVAKVHCAAFPDSALTRLGQEAVQRYYRWLLEGPHDAVALGVWRENDLVGFCFAGVFRGATSGFLSSNRGYLLRRVLARPWLLFSPLFRERIALAIKLLSRRVSFASTRSAASVSAPAPSAPRFGVLAIATHPQYQGKGVGRALMEACETAARARGANRMNLSVHPSNAPAIGFYERLGWTRQPDADGSWRHGAMSKSLL